MIETEKDAISQALSTILARNIGSAVTPEIVNGVLVALNQVMSQLPKPSETEKMKTGDEKKIKEVKNGPTPNNPGDDAQAAPVS